MVHIERIKSFTNLTDTAPTGDNGAQSKCRKDAEETTDNASTDEDTTAGQPDEPSPKKKQPKEKKVRFTAAEEETRTPTKTAEPTQREETDQNRTPREETDQHRRYPLRIRKKRFALASTLLYAMVISLTAHPTPTETVAQTTSVNPAVWWTFTLLLTTTKITPVDGALEVKLSSHGVIFQSLGERFFSDSEWVIVTDISFDQTDKVAKELKLWLTEKQKYPYQTAPVTKTSGCYRQ